MATNPVDTAIKRMRGWLGAHVEATALHAAGELHLLSSLREQASTPRALAERYDYEPYAVRVLLDILARLEIVTKEAGGSYRLADALQSADEREVTMTLTAAAGGWQSLSSFTPAAYAPLLQCAREAATHHDAPAARLLECAWGYVWSAGLMEAGKRRLLSSLQDHPRSFVDLAGQCHLSEEDLRQLCVVGQYTGVLSQ